MTAPRPVRFASASYATPHYAPAPDRLAFAPNTRPPMQGAQPYPMRPLAPVRPAAPVSRMDTHLAEARAERKPTTSRQLRTLFLFFGFWLGAAGLFLALYVSRLA